jgi:hypothetical protein
MITGYSISGQEYIPIMADYIHSSPHSIACWYREKRHSKSSNRSFIVGILIIRLISLMSQKAFEPIHVHVKKNSHLHK